MTKLIIVGSLLIVSILFLGVAFSSKGQRFEVNNTFSTPEPQVKSIIHGTVYYPDGVPVSEALVSTYKKMPLRDNAVREFDPTTESEKNGYYELEFSKGGIYELCAWKQIENYLLANAYAYGILPGGKCETVTIGEGERLNIDLTLGTQANSLRGKISDWKAMYRLDEATIVVYRPLKHVEEAKGKVKFVLTTLEEADWDAKAEVKPNEKGEFVVNGLPEGDYFLRLEFPDQETWFYKTGSDKGPTPIHVKNKAKNEIEFSFYAMSGRAAAKVDKKEH